jgi:hypothetical protein
MNPPLINAPLKGSTRTEHVFQTTEGYFSTRSTGPIVVTIADPPGLACDSGGSSAFPGKELDLWKICLSRILG